MKVLSAQMLMAVSLVAVVNADQLSLNIYQRLFLDMTMASVVGFIFAGRGGRKSLKLKLQIALETGAAGLMLGLLTNPIVDDLSMALLIFAACGGIGMGGRPAVDFVSKILMAVIKNITNSVNQAVNEKEDDNDEQ